MLKAGHTQKLTITRISEYGLYLADEEQAEVLLPNRYVSLTDRVGHVKEGMEEGGEEGTRRPTETKTLGNQNG